MRKEISCEELNEITGGSYYMVWRDGIRTFTIGTTNKQTFSFDEENGNKILEVAYDVFNGRLSEEENDTNILNALLQQKLIY